MAVGRQDHRGIPFDDWLELFLEYAVGLAHSQRVQDAYAVCRSARDSTVYQARGHMFLIHLTWASCAIFAADEETCVAVARYFMRDEPYTTDTYRLYAAMCRLCQAPSSWYSSGPAQKFMLRQIRSMDEALLLHPDKPGGPAGGFAGDGVQPAGLDVCLLVIYGHILFASSSYTYALNYFHRAATLDPTNPLVNLSVGMSYIHWALKRQADNRQYRLTQGFGFLFRYYENRVRAASCEERQEAHFNMARTYHLLGLHALAAQFYQKVLAEAATAGPDEAGSIAKHGLRG